MYIKHSCYYSVLILSIDNISLVVKEQFSKSLKGRDCVTGEFYLESQLHLLVILSQLVNLPGFFTLHLWETDSNTCPLNGL